MDKRIYKVIGGTIVKNLFHVHTTWGEGSYTPEQWLEYAVDNGIEEITFIDFVPPTLWDEYLDNMNQIKSGDIKVRVGIEVSAKALNQMKHTLIDAFDVIAVSERCIDPADDVYKVMSDALIKWDGSVLYWVRPGWWYKKYGKTLLGLEYYVEILRSVPEDKVILEVNRKYNVPPPYIPALLDELGFSFVLGWDVGSPEEIPSYEIPLLGFTFADAEE